jgi:hypothetical protein
MNDVTPNPPLRNSKILTFIIVFFVLSSMGIVMNIVYFFNRDRANIVGDGVNVSSYGFDLSNCLVDQNYIVASGIFKDGREITDFPEFMPTADMDAVNEEIRGKYQVSGDRVIGVDINGDVRAYPIRIMQWHEVINDQVGGVPIAVTYSPLSGSVVVFDRRVGGETLEFGVSGLLYNSTLLLYDRRENDADESLWSQLQFRAISGKAAEQGTALKTLPCVLSRWADWKERYPGSKVIKPNLTKIRQYQIDPFGPYQSMDDLNHDVSPEPPLDVYQNKTNLIIFRVGQSLYTVPLPLIKEKAGDGHIWNTDIAGQSIQINYSPQPETAFVMNDLSTFPDDFSVVYAYHFAWYSHFPNLQYSMK